MFQTLDIRNFQRHKSLKIDFGRITTIVGSNGAGKTAALRALYWLCFNRPFGTSFIRRGSDKARAKLTADDHEVERRRTKDGNQYVLDGGEFSAIGTDVPEEIASVLNVRVENFQGQLDSPFWLSLSPGQVSKELNEIVDLSLIDTSMSFVDGEYRKEKARRGIIAERINTVTAHVERLSFVPTMDEQLEQLENQHAQLQAVEEQGNGLQIRMASLTKWGQTIKQHRARVETGTKWIDQLSGLNSELINVRDREEALEDLCCQCEVRSTKAKLLRAQLKELEKQLHERFGGRCPMCEREFGNGDTTGEGDNGTGYS